MGNTEISIYIDSKIAEAVFGEDLFYKKATILSDLTSSIGQYVSNHIDPDDKTGSLLNILAPGAISVLLGGKVGLLFGFLMRAFNIDVAGILRSAYEGIKSLLSQHGQMSSDQVDDVVQAAVQQGSGEVAPIKASMLLRDAKLFKLALDDYEQNLYKEAKPFGMSKGQGLNLLMRILGFVFKVSIYSAGLMVAGDAVNKLLGRPNAFDGTFQKGKPVEQPQAAPAPTSKQTKFPVKAGYSDVQHDSSSNWIERYPNNESGIQSMLVSFTKEVYDGLDGLEGAITSSPLFKATVDNIAWYNHMAAGDQIVFIPRFFKSKKDIVDHFIDDVASRAGGSSTSIPSAPLTPTPTQKSNPFDGIPRKDLA